MAEFSRAATMAAAAGDRGQVTRTRRRQITSPRAVDGVDGVDDVCLWYSTILRLSRLSRLRRLRADEMTYSIISY